LSTNAGPDEEFMTELHHPPITTPPPTQVWHAVEPARALEALESTPHGVDEAERAARRARYGANVVGGGRKPKRWLPELAESFTEPLQLLLIAVAVLSAIFGELSDAVAIAVVIAVVAVLETATEMRAARSIEALRAMTAPTARLVGPDVVREVAAADLVPGDVIVVEAGDVAPADARVLAARGLRVDESTLTGEAAPVGKDATAVDADAPLAARSSVLYAGTGLVADTKEPRPPCRRRCLSWPARCWSSRSWPASRCRRSGCSPASRSGTCCCPG
jgi:Ca2+-transporting ATPase